MYKGRRIIGNLPDIKHESISAFFESDKIRPINSINEDWEQHLGEELMRFQPPQTKVFVKKEFSLIRFINAAQIQYLEQVIVHFQSPEGKQTSFKAYIDPSNGHVLSTWNRTIHEQIGQEIEGMVPTGQL